MQAPETANSNNWPAEGRGLPTYHTLDEVCQITRTCKSTVYNLIRSGKLKVTKVAGRTLIRDGNLSEYLRSCEQ